MGENNPMNLFHDSANDVKDRIGHPASIVFPVGAKADILLLPLVPFIALPPFPSSRKFPVLAFCLQFYHMGIYTILFFQILW